MLQGRDPPGLRRSPADAMPTPDYLAPYTDAARASGARFEALLWRSREGQIARFDAAIRLGRPGGRVVADMGCGLANFNDRLVERGAEHAKYVGVEAIPELAEAARARVSQTGVPASIIEADFASDGDLFRRLVESEAVDLVVFGGSLNTFRQRDAVRVLERAWSALEGVPHGRLVFNFLSDRCEERERRMRTAPAHRFDTAKMLDWAMRRTPLVAFDQSYLRGHDATVGMTVQPLA